MTRQTCPCCGTLQPPHSAIAYCDDCNTDTCGHHNDAAPRRVIRDRFLDDTHDGRDAEHAADEECRRIEAEGGTVYGQQINPTRSGWTIHTEYQPARKEHP